MNNKEQPINKTVGQRYLYRKGEEVFGDNSLLEPNIEVRRAGAERVKKNALAAGILVLTAAAWLGGAKYAAEHGSAGPLNNGKPVEQQQDNVNQAPPVIMEPNAQPTDIVLPK